MTGNNHRLFGSGLALVAGIIIEPIHGILVAGAIVAASVPGSTAPDWMEIRAVGRTLIPHRTFTHILILWIAALSLGLYTLAINPILGAIITGFSIGGLSHWVGDVGTPMGVPVWHPFRRVSLKLWRTGTSEALPVLAVWCLVVGLLFIRTASPFS